MHMLGYPTHFGQMETLKLIAGNGYPEKVWINMAISGGRREGGDSGGGGQLAGRTGHRVFAWCG